jgi:DNA polymerase
MILADQESIRIVETYRSTFPNVPKLWRELNNAISILAGGSGSYSIGPCVFERGRISLPNGLYLHYHNLRHSPQQGWVYDHAGKPRRLYGGALLENIVQALARIIVMDAALRIEEQIKAAGLQLALQVHDALAYVVPERFENAVSEIIAREMYKRPTWAPELPLAAELQRGYSYGDLTKVEL